MSKRSISRLCSRCRLCHPARGGAYCHACHAAYMREWRQTHRLSEEAKIKDRARSYANVYKQRGLLKQEPCEVCGDLKSQMHHDDYSKPLAVRWFCRRHHQYHHEDIALGRTPLLASG